MISKKHYKDTWFIVCEEDFRLHRMHDVDVTSSGSKRTFEETLDVRAKHIGFETHEKGKPLGADKLAAADDLWAGASIEFLLRTAKSHQSSASFTTEIRDMVKMGIYASRNDAADLLWYNWCPGGTREMVPVHGLMCIGLSVFGAQMLLEAMTTWTPRHFDLALLEWLEAKGNDAEAVEAGYVTPSVGHYATHLSNCEESIGIRNAEWDKTYIQEGTRGGKRWIAGFTKKGQGIDYKSDAPIPFDDPNLVWKTQKPPTEEHLAAVLREKLPLDPSSRILRELRQCLHAFKFRNLVETEEEAVGRQSINTFSPFAMSRLRAHTPSLRPGHSWFHLWFGIVASGSNAFSHRERKCLFIPRDAYVSPTSKIMVHVVWPVRKPSAHI